MTKTIRRLDVLIKEFETAATAKSWKGSSDPRHYADIDQDYQKARTKLREFVLARITETHKGT